MAIEILTTAARLGRIHVSKAGKRKLPDAKTEFGRSMREVHAIKVSLGRWL
jgi:hypothetical protein